jgi:pimeloyl-ACP methyl ester carboxylesterase
MVGRPEKQRVLLFLIPAACAFTLIFLTAFRDPFPGIGFSEHRLVNDRGQPLRVQLFAPSQKQTQTGAALILAHPLNNSSAFSHALAVECAHHGYSALVFDWAGREKTENRQLQAESSLASGSSDVRAAAAFLRGLESIDSSRIYAAGHSVGATFCLDAAATDPGIAGVAGIGMDAPPAEPYHAAVLYAAGLYDEFVTPGQLRAVVEEAGQITRAAMAVSPASDHFTEWQDGRIHRYILAWLEQADTGAVRVSAARKTIAQTGLLLFLAGCFLLAAYPVFHGRGVLLRVIPAAVMIAAVSLMHSASPRTASAAGERLLLLLLIALAADYCCHIPRSRLTASAKKAGMLLLILWLSLFLTLILNRLPEFWRQPRYLLYLPAFLLFQPLHLFRLYGLLYPAQLFFSAGAEYALRISPVFWILLAVETVSPGAFCRVPAAGLKRIATKRRAGVKRKNTGALVIFGILALLLAGLVLFRLQQGFLTGESAGAALLFMLRFGLPPVFFFFLLRRLLLRRRGPET